VRRRVVESVVRERVGDRAEMVESGEVQALLAPVPEVGRERVVRSEAEA